MQQTIVDIIGYSAGFLTTVAYLPQAIRIWKTRKTDGLSTGMYSLMVAGVASWFLYGIAIRSIPVVVTNAVTLAIAAFILVIKLRIEPKKSLATTP